MGEESPQSSRGVENIGDKESKGLACFSNNEDALAV